MKTLEEKIINNKSEFERKFVNVSSGKAPQSNRVKFTSGWGDGWENGKPVQFQVKTNKK